ncbi:MAG: secondary thiamine-phosphate synthase enzyme YjbQ [Deltaproteobacteria bacterium]|nr:secondary thiamine-phosphate synthase enzyme YjbQ [Deltaproteobacteria bacterium]
MKIKFENIRVGTEQNNLMNLDVKLTPYIGEHNFFCVQDLTEMFHEMVSRSGIQNGSFIAQILHTTCVLSVNELDEPMLLGDISRQLEKHVPKIADYLHNSKLRTANLCEDDYKCDRNADAHIKSFLIGNHTMTLLVRDGKLVLGRWQRVGLVDFDGPRNRDLVVQISGE